MAGILGYGVYVPKYRILAEEIGKIWTGQWKVATGVKEKSVPGVDEDSITMAVEAAGNALAHSGIVPEKIGALYVGTVSSPYIEKSAAVTVGEVLNLPSGAIMMDFGGSTKAGTNAILACMDLVQSGKIDYAVAIGTDSLHGFPGEAYEQTLGAGAAAFVIAKEGTIASLDDSSSYSTGFVSTYRPAGDEFRLRHRDPRVERTYGYPRHAKEAVQGLMVKTGKNITDFDYVALYQPDCTSPKVVAKSLGIKPDVTAASNIAAHIGNTGSSSTLLALASVLDKAKPGDQILAVSYGSGAGSDALKITALDGIEISKSAAPLKRYIETKEYLDYIRYQKFEGALAAPALMPDRFSSYNASPGASRELDYTIKLKALKCKKCGGINFPARNYCSEIDCRGQEFEKVDLPRTGKILTYCPQYLSMIAPEETPLVIGIAQLDGAEGNYTGKIQAIFIDIDPEKVTVGTPVKLVFRRCGEELGLIKYGYKFKLLEDL